MAEDLPAGLRPDEILVTRAGGVVTVTLNRPAQRNAMARPMWHRLAQILKDVARDPGDRVLVLTGAGGAFCSGADLGTEDRTALPLATLMGDVADTATALLRLGKPTVARVDGPAVGAGLGMALACDVVVASSRARLSASFSKRAMSTDFAASWLLPRVVGLRAAKKLVLFADMLDAEEAERLGLVDEVVATEDLDAAVAALTTRLLALPQAAVSRSKEMLTRSFEVTLEQALEAEARAQASNLAGDDVREARLAFTEKREPVYHRPASPGGATAGAG